MSSPRRTSVDRYRLAMRRAIIAAGGWAHPGDDIIAAAQSLITPHGFAQVDVVRNGHALAQALTQQCDLLIVGACWFSMSDDRYTEAQRAEHAVPLTTALTDALVRVRNAGCPVLALHTAVICFDGAPEWREWLGGTWNWQTSFHPPPAEIEVHPSEPAATSSVSFDPFVVSDELYQGLDLDDGVSVIAESAHGDPLVWLHETTTGRSAVNVLGHDRRSLADPAHQQLNQQLLGWLLSEETSG